MVEGFENEEEADAFVHAIARNWREAHLNAVDTALCNYAVRLTKAPQAMREGDIKTLRSAGLSDRAIHDATQVISYFNYINRIADALGVEPETFIRHWGNEEDEADDPEKS